MSPQADTQTADSFWKWWYHLPPWIAALILAGLPLAIPWSKGGQKPALDEWVEAFYLFALTSLGIYAIELLLKYYRLFRSERELLKKDSADVHNNLAKIGLIRPLLTLHDATPGRFIDTLKKLMNQAVHRGGGIIIHANEHDYLDYIQGLLIPTSDLFFATLRGGELKPEYTLDWFFGDFKRKKDLGTETLPGDVFQFDAVSQKRVKYLQNVMEAKHIKRRIRVLVFSEDEEAFIKPFSDETKRNLFLRLNDGIELYLVSPVDLFNWLDARGVSNSDAQFVWEDFAFFDNTMVLKHNSRTSLFLGVDMQIRLYKLLCDLVLENLGTENVKILTLTHIGVNKWDDWLSANVSNGRPEVTKS